MSQFIIRKINSKDLTHLQAISRKTFSETFAEHNTKDDLNAYLDQQLSIEQLNEEINNIHSAFYLAEENNKVIGYLKLNWSNAQTEMIDAEAVEIERIYVLKEYFGKGLGQFIIDTAIDIAKKMLPTYIWLGVWEKNARAIHFYEKNGFTIFSSHAFKLGNDIQTDLLMKLDIKLNL
jgi:ribosomal protein S18 acetylase RimI-like enzyme